MDLDSESAERFANLALSCIHREYPNKIAHTLSSDADVGPPHELTPVFYGCYDWHSAVHGHWLLARLARLFPGARFTPRARAALEKSLTAENLRREAAYVGAPGRDSFERPYGLAWLLQLAAELHEWSDAQHLSSNLRPLETVVVDRLRAWLPKLAHPVRSGEHSQTAFALGLVLDYATTLREETLIDLISTRAQQFYFSDRDCPLAYEPSGEDFLSPCLAEADLMRRALPRTEFAEWLRNFMPQIPSGPGSDWFRPAVSPDPSDPKLAHLDGLNLSRAWMLEGVAAGLPENDPRAAAIRSAADAHARAGLAAVTGEHYVGSHWLGTFAVYLLTRRGLQQK
ncbi:MAG TPA: DUF2891 domain-containing protein [Terriglobales bacterium]|nr:DUF2891 domain-containing protein [Terriglobales bacterium]